MFVGVISNSNPSGVTYAGAAMTFQQTYAMTFFQFNIYKILAPASGANNVVVTGGGGAERTVALSWTGGDTGSQPNASGLGNNVNTNPLTSSSTSTVDGCMLFGICASGTNSSVSSYSAGANTTLRANIANGTQTGIAAFQSSTGVTSPAGSQTLECNDVNGGSFSQKYFYTFMVQPPQVASKGNFLLFFN